MIKYIRGNTIIFSLLILFILIGICIGAFWVGIMSYETKDVLRSYINSFFVFLSTYPLDANLIFKTSIKNNIIPIVILFFVSMTYLGVILAPLYITFRGFCLGFSIAFLTESFGKKGFLFTLISLLPQNIIYIPTVIFACFVSMEFSLKMLRYKKEKFYENKNKQIITYFTYDLLIIIFLITASVIEAYITPIFINAISPYFLKL